MWSAQRGFSKALSASVTDQAERLRASIEGVRAEWSRTSARTASIGERWEAERARMRKVLHGRIAEVLPRHDGVTRMLRRHQAELAELVRPRIDA